MPTRTRTCVILLAMSTLCLIMMAACSPKPVFPDEADAAVAVQKTFGTSTIAELPASYSNPNFETDESHLDAPKDMQPGFSSSWHWDAMNSFANTWFKESSSKDYCAIWGVRRDASGELFTIWGMTNPLTIDASTFGYEKGRLGTDYFDRKMSAVQDELRELNEEAEASGIQVRHFDSSSSFSFTVSSEADLPKAAELVSRYDSVLDLDYNAEAFERYFFHGPMNVLVYVGDRLAGDVKLSGSDAGRLSSDDVFEQFRHR